MRARIAGCDGLVTGWGASDRRLLRPRGAMALTPAIMEAADRLRIIAHAAGSVRQMLGEVWRDYISARSAKRLMEYALHVRDTGGWRSPRTTRGLATCTPAPATSVVYRDGRDGPDAVVCAQQHRVLDTRRDMAIGNDRT